LHLLSARNAPSVSCIHGSRGVGGAWHSDHQHGTHDILDTMIAAGNLMRFASAVDAAGLTDELAAKGSFTVSTPCGAGKADAFLTNIAAVLQETL
jgi:uncharacterized surface protein with fasciclin (FAS1) repeats